MEAHQTSEENEKQDSCPECGKSHHHSTTISTDGGLFGDGAVVRCSGCGTEYDRQL